MTKYKATRVFADAETGQLYQPGDAFTGTQERIAELVTSGRISSDSNKKNVKDSAKDGSDAPVSEHG